MEQWIWELQEEQLQQIVALEATWINKEWIANNKHFHLWMIQ